MHGVADQWRKILENLGENASTCIKDFGATFVGHLLPAMCPRGQAREVARLAPPRQKTGRQGPSIQRYRWGPEISSVGRRTA